MSIVAVDCFMRYTDEKGNVWVQEHRIIKNSPFVQNQIDEYKRNKGKAEQITEDQYKRERKK